MQIGVYAEAKPEVEEVDESERIGWNPELTLTTYDPDSSVNFNCATCDLTSLGRCFSNRR